MPFALKRQMTTSYADKRQIKFDLAAVSLGFHRGITWVFRYCSGLWIGQFFFLSKKRLIEQIHGCP
jgi:hypothetical protein